MLFYSVLTVFSNETQIWNLPGCHFVAIFFSLHIALYVLNVHKWTCKCEFSVYMQHIAIKIKVLHPCNCAYYFSLY